MKPFATILRYSWSNPDGEGETLVVTKLGRREVCHMDYVQASGNPRANEQARALADAGAFDCMHQPLNYAGSIIKD